MEFCKWNRIVRSMELVGNDKEGVIIVVVFVSIDILIFYVCDIAASTAMATRLDS